MALANLGGHTGPPLRLCKLTVSPAWLGQGGALLFLCAGFYLPLLFFLAGANPLLPEESFLQWKFFREFLSDPWNLEVIGFTFYQAFWSAILSILFALPGAWLLVHYRFPGKRWFRMLTFLPFVLPSIVVVLTMVLFLGNNGWVNRALMFLLNREEPPLRFLYSLSGILIAHVYYNFPLAMKIITDQWERVSHEFGYAASSLGAGSARRMVGITLPLLLPSMGSAFVLIFLLCINSFPIILVLGGGIRHTTMEVLIYQLARIELDLNGAACLAFLQAGMSLAALAVLLRKPGSLGRPRRTTPVKLFTGLRRGSFASLFGTFWLTLILVFTLGPLLAVVTDSLRFFHEGVWGWSLHWYERLFSLREGNRFALALWNSLRIGFGSALVSCLLGMGMVSFIISRKGASRRFVEGALLLPMALSSVVFGVSWFHFHQQWLIDSIPLVLILVGMHGILTCPYWIRVILPTLETVPLRWKDESFMLGRKTWEHNLLILLPWLRQTMLIAFFFSFALSLGELNSIMMIADESVRTLPLEIYGAISAYRFSYASAVAVVLVLCTALSLLLMETVLITRPDSRLQKQDLKKVF